MNPTQPFETLYVFQRALCQQRARTLGLLMLLCNHCVSSLVSQLQRAQARCLAVVDKLTGAARWRMMR